jgi:6-pyruvoyltetrahydropterin/6-carboxytetrahydropterin synthase
MIYRSTKTYTHEVGLSACFRQWRAKSHCRFLHGYALSFRFEFEATELDENNWVVDFGSLKSLKSALEFQFDHKTVVARDDPQREAFARMAELGVCQLLFVDATGCESFARIGFGLAQRTLEEARLTPRVRVISCECREHGANSAIFFKRWLVTKLET